MYGLTTTRLYNLTEATSQMRRDQVRLHKLWPRNQRL